MAKYVLRLDDASNYRDQAKWDKIEELLDKYGVKPLVGVIPDNKDPKMMGYENDKNFWQRVHFWDKKGWEIALHGYDHVYISCTGGDNPVNKKSEFAGVSLEIQKEKIKKGVEIFKANGINPAVFFAPSHTFDKNTLIALKEESDIRIISDTVANKPYSKDGFTFVPQQSGRVRNLPFKLITFCYHPNRMTEKDFCQLEKFLSKRAKKFVSFPRQTTNRKLSLFDKFLSKLYFFMR